MVPGMGTVTSLSDVRERRAAAIASVAPMHPALRYLVGGDGSVAHRRTPMGRTVCGTPGDLYVARVETPLCDVCYEGRAG
jgi:hypothetical protein